jgi:Fe2+ transport system protein FeoA
MAATRKLDAFGFTLDEALRIVSRAEFSHPVLA